LSDDVVLPPRGSNWWHWYASPKSGATLRTGKQIGDWQWEHIDPVNGDVYLGDPTDPSRDFDGVVLSQKHGGWATAVERLGIAFQVTGDRKYAEKAREILLAYADKYLDYPLHTTRNEPKIGGGRVGPQTLDESTWLIRMAQGADLIWDSLSDDDRTTLAEKLFLPAARDVILPHKMSVHNIQCWKNSAVGLVGFLLGDADLIWEAIENPDSGYRKQMAEGVAPDGAWWEGAWGYHFYTMSALWPLTEAARNSGIDLYDDAFRGMFDAPIRFAMPDLTLPAFNDSGAVNLAGRASMYELGYARYGVPDYVDLLARGGRNNDFALWYGEDIASDVSNREWTSANHPESGYAILARGAGAEATWLCLKYGPHGGGHGHPDKLNFVLYARGQQVATDPGTARYGQPIQRSWYRTTLAHNTLVVDGESQQAATGRLLAFGSAGDVDYVTAEAGDIYDGVQFTRTVALLSEDLVVFLDRVEADRERTFDIAYHQLGRWDDLPDADPWAAADTDGYLHMRDGHARRVDGVTLRGEIADGVATAVTLASNEATTVVTGTGVGDHLEDRVPMVIFRRSAKHADFAWAVSLTGEAADIAWDGELLTVSDNAGGRWRLRIQADGTLTRD
ncbi:alginate lyase family protein, partial [Candidatus Poribacteria bacterium]|nr:alginate lyase family protein [Candidatus Poribacteria bacterium]